MSRIPTLSIEQAVESARPLLEGVQKRIGFLPNIFKTLAHAPAVLSAYMQHSAALGKTSLTAVENETIALATSQINECDYCFAAHTLFASKSGMTASEIESVRYGRLHAIAALSKKSLKAGAA